MENLLLVAQNSAKMASELILNAWQSPQSFKINEKAPKDLVTEIDQAVEQVLIHQIRSHFPDHSILSEESGALLGNEFTWVIDPIDGTTNFARGIPHFAISIGIKQFNELIVGMIYDPIRNEMFSAIQGKGAFLNDKKIAVRQQHNLENAVIATGFPSKRQQLFPGFMDCLKTIFPDLLGLRRGGAATLDLAYIAAGRLDGYWEFDVREWDIAAGELLIKEAGGTLCDISGNNHFPQHGIIAGTTGVCQTLANCFQPIWQKELQPLFLALEN